MTAIAMAAMPIDTITILHARYRRLAKLVREDGVITAYDSARTFDLQEAPVADLASLERLLRRLVQRQDCSVVRGVVRDTSRVQGVRRLIHPDRKTGDAPTLCEMPRRWVALDFDDLSRPPDVAAIDLMACALVAIQVLPEAFHDTQCIAQATASHGLRPGIRLRLWYWLSRPTGGLELKHWLRDAPVDKSVLGAGQVIYTAAPVFTEGTTDPLLARIVAVRGSLAEVIVPPAAVLARPPRKRPAVPNVDAVGVGQYGFAALRSATAHVAGAAAGTRHQSLLNEARGLARLAVTGVLSEGAVRTALVGAAEMAGLDHAEAESVVAWALAHPACCGGVRL